LTEQPRNKDVEKQLSNETRLGLVVADIEQRLMKVPVNIAFGALATLAGRLITMSHKDEDKRRHNRFQFDHTVTTVMRMEEEKVAAEALIRREIDREVERQQRADPLVDVNRKAVELDVRARVRQKAVKDAH